MRDNPLIDDNLVRLLMSDVADAASLTQLEAFREHSLETFELYVDSCRRLAREVLLPTYQEMDARPPELVDGEVKTHPALKRGYDQLTELGVVSATRPEEVGGQQLPLTVAALAHAYLMAGNLSVTGLAGLTNGAAHLVEEFGDEAAKRAFLDPMYEGRWTGTMALTEPQAGSSLGDLTTTATRAGDGSYRIKGAKIFISGGAHDAAENVVNLTLARIDGAPAGTKGISLFAVPKRRLEDGALVDNDVRVSGLIHKIGWRGLPSLALAFGDEDDCHGWLIGAEGRGLAQMFQMMNEARLMVGLNGVATASVGYQESLAYARERRQGRPLGVRDPAVEPVPLIEHADVRRMLLRQKAIVDGGLCLQVIAARYADVAQHHADGAARQEASLILDLLTPVAKSFPAEYGYEANALAVQVHGGYGYSSEYPVEAWLRDQKLNSIHEGTTGIQSLDLLGRKVVAGAGAGLRALSSDVEADLSRAPEELAAPVRAALGRVQALTMALGQRGMSGDLSGMLAHSADYLQLFSILVVSWMHVKLANAVSDRADAFADGLRRGARYWVRTELPRVELLAELCESAEDSYVGMSDESFG